MKFGEKKRADEVSSSPGFIKHQFDKHPFLPACANRGEEGCPEEGEKKTGEDMISLGHGHPAV